MRVTLIAADGAACALEGRAGESVMGIATQVGAGNIVGECGGSVMCATCHVIVDPAWSARLPPPSDLEDMMLDSTGAPRQPNSRLSCQIVLEEGLDGLVLHLPEFQ